MCLKQNRQFRYIVLGSLLCICSWALAAEPEWKAIECPEAESPLSRRMQVGRILDDFEASPLPWKSQLGGQNAQSRVALAAAEKHTGQASLQVDYEFGGKEEYEYVGVYRSLKIPDDANGLGF